MIIKRIFIIITTMFLSPALAEDDFKWNTSVGIVAFSAPKHEGADKYEQFVLPVIDAQYGPVFLSAMRGLGFFLPVNESRTLIFSPALRWRTKRNLDDAEGTVEFIERIRPTVTLNTILKLDPVTFNIRITRGLVASDRGSAFNFGIAYGAKISEKTNFSVYTTAIYGDKHYNQTYYGITESESRRYGYKVYEAYAGLRSLDIGFALNHSLTETLSLSFMTEYLRIVDAAANSPVVFSPDQIMLSLGVNYKF